MTSRRARLQWAALATGAVAAVALALKVVGVADDVEFLATLLVAPVVGATLLVDRNLGYVTAAIAAVAYLYLRFDDIQAAGAIGVVVLVAFRAGSYLFVAHLTPLLFDRFTGGASAGAGGGSSGRHLRAEAVDPWAPAEDDDLAPTSAYAPVGLADEPRDPLVPLVPVGSGRSRYEPDPADAEYARSWEDDELPVDDWGAEAAAYQAQEPPAPRVPTGWIDDATSPLGDEQIPVGFTGELFLGRITGATPVVGANGGGRNGAGAGAGPGAGTNGSGGARPRVGARSYDRDIGYDDEDGWSTAPPSGAPLADPYGDDDRRRPAPAFSGAGDADPYDRRDEPRPPAVYNGGADGEVDHYGYDGRGAGVDRRDPGDDRLTEPMYGGPVDDQAVARSESLARPWAAGAPAGAGSGTGGATYDWPPAGGSGRPDHAWDTTPPPGNPAPWDEPPPTRRVPAVDPPRRPPTGPVPVVPTAAHPAAAADPRAYEPRPAPAPAVDPSAGIDPETRLWNAQFFRHRLNTAIEHSKRTANSFSVVMVQVADEPFQPLPYRRQVALLRELGHQFVPRFVDHLVHLPDGAQHWFAVVLVDTDRAGAAAFEKRLSTTIAGYLRSRGLRVGDVQSASLTSPDDDEAMAAIWASLLGADTAAP